MSSSSEHNPSTAEALLSIDDRLVAVSESAESSRSATVSEQRVEPESRAVDHLEDEVTQCKSLLLEAELGSWGQGFKFSLRFVPLPLVTVRAILRRVISISTKKPWRPV